jgi:hypothetical protein
MRCRDVRLLAFRLTALTALAGSAFPLVQPLLSGECGVCKAQATLVLGRWAVPLPWLGLADALALLLLSFWPGTWARRLRTDLALAGGGVGLGLLILQIGFLGFLCPNCAMVDLAMLVAAVLVTTERNASSVSAEHPYTSNS